MRGARRHSAALAGKWLGSMAAREAARELLENTDLPQQRQVLLRMKAHRAAALLEVIYCYFTHSKTRAKIFIWSKRVDR